MKIVYLFLQCTWGILQTLLGGVLFLCNAKRRHFCYHGAIVTIWKNKSSVSLGCFLFLTEESYFYEKLKEEYTKEELSRRLLVHEYGHTIQSLLWVPCIYLLWEFPLRYGDFYLLYIKGERRKIFLIFPFLPSAGQIGLVSA